jgi:hypothetical protein
VASFAPVARWRTPALQDTITFINSVTGALPAATPGR